MWSDTVNARGPWKSPQQVCAFRTLQGLQAYSPVGEPFGTMDSANVSRLFAQLSVGESLGHVGAWSLHTSPEPILAQSSDGAEMDPGFEVFLPHTLCRQPVTDRDIHQQSRKVKRAGKRLAMAWRADRLVRGTEKARSPES